MTAVGIVALCFAGKRCATNLGDQFGLSLYNKGQLAPLVKGTLVMPGDPDGQAERVSVPEDLQDGLAPQVDMGDERPPDEVEDDFPPDPGPKVSHVEKMALAEAKARVWKAAKALGMEGDDTISDYAATHDAANISDASVVELNEYAERLEAMRTSEELAPEWQTAS